MMGAICVSVSGCVAGFAQARSQTSPSDHQVRGYSLEVRHLKFHKMIPSSPNFHYLRRRLMGGEPSGPQGTATASQGTWVIEDSWGTRIGTLFSFPWSEKGREGGGR